jgi:hypothetical protein
MHVKERLAKLHFCLIATISSLCQKKLAQGRIIGIADGSIATFKSVDINSGLAPTIAFRSSENETVTLVEVSSSKTSSHGWSSDPKHFWARTTFTKKYRYETENFNFRNVILEPQSYPDRGEIRMECIDYNARL